MVRRIVFSLLVLAAVIVPMAPASASTTHTYTTTFFTTSSYACRFGCRTDYGPTYGPDFSHGRIAISMTVEDCYLSGTVVLDDSKGDSITASYYAVATDFADVGGLRVNLTITGGTGAYTGATGDGKVTSVGDAYCNRLPNKLTGTVDLNVTVP